MRYIIILISYFVVNVEVEIAGKSVPETYRGNFAVYGRTGPKNYQ